MRGRAQFKERAALFFRVRAKALEIIGVLREKIALVGGDDLLARGELGAVFAQLGVDRIEILHRIAAFAAGYVHQMDEQTAAVDVPQKIMSETRALGRAFDDAGDIGHYEGDALVDVDDAEVGKERRKVVVGDLGMRLADDGQKRGFAYVRETDQTDVCQQLELQRDVVALAGKARLRKAWDLARGRGEMDVAPAAAAAFCGDPILAGGHIVHDRAAFGVSDDRAARHLDDERIAVAAVAALALSRHAVGRDVFALVAKIHQRGHVVVHGKDHAAAAAAVAAVRAARRDVFLAVESHGAVAAVSRADRDPRFINK